eukprot:gnl/TRDRNA2_/TRDRNA2_84650_c0_seq1.p1 gnl/TRDRNA2_/TRDRNA2_84650_c0~~gnl/TRDRNA2_/TRDRNA2_84650_c0_seq1.p1  ORF type:complete len:359 (-),score=62.76 gnl/TRDRNA2_/TRDRNA2_84650_c0_seq1:56-1132(-)
MGALQRKRSVVRPYNVVSAISFVLAYLLLVPGLFCTLFSAKATFMGITVLDMEKSTFGTIDLLMGKGKWVPALTILFFSVIMPVVKMFVLLAYSYCANLRGEGTGRGNSLADAVVFVQWVSKWATIDAFAAATIVGFFCTRPLLKVELHDGFFCFLGYCLLSTFGALLLDPTAGPPQETPADDSASTAYRHLHGSPARALLYVVGSLCALSVAVDLPIVQVQARLLFMEDNLSIRALATQLWLYNSRVAAVAVVGLTVALPALEMVIAALGWAGYRSSNPTAPRWLRDFAMLDVFALAMVVVSLATSGLHEDLKVRVLPMGRCLVGGCVAWVCFNATMTPSAPVKDMSRSKLDAYRVV